MYNIMNKLFGYRWSLYISDNNRVIHYAAHSDNVYTLLFAVAELFLDSGNPKEPWKIYINYNKKQKEILLDKELFTKDGFHGISRELIDKIRLLDNNFEKRLPDEKPIFIDLINNREVRWGISDLG